MRLFCGAGGLRDSNKREKVRIKQEARSVVRTETSGWQKEQPTNYELVLPEHSGVRCTSWCSPNVQTNPGARAPENWSFKPPNPIFVGMKVVFLF